MQLQYLLVTHFGGNSNNGLNAGSFYWNLNNSTSNRNRNIMSYWGLLNIQTPRHFGINTLIGNFK